MIIILYVDDMFIFSTNHELVLETLRYLASKFGIKDMGEANIILDVKIIRKGDSLMLSQEHYVYKLLKKLRQFDVKLMSTPYDANT